MLTSSPSPTIYPSTALARSSASLPYLSRSHYDGRHHTSPQSTSTSILSRPPSSHHPIPAVSPSHRRNSPSIVHLSNTEASPSFADCPSEPAPGRRPRMVDASTQYSPPDAARSTPSLKTPHSKVAGLQVQDPPPTSTTSDAPTPSRASEGIMASPSRQAKEKQHADHSNSASSASSTKRNATEQAAREPPDDETGVEETTQGSPKRPRKTEQVKVMPMQYENCDTRDLVVLISSMLMELIRYNDAIPLRDGHLTRFHSRAPPGISVQDYLQRLTTHATLSPPILLSMVYYIDRLCALYPSFTISSLTVHRFLITSATVASKGLSDSFWTNKTYARVGGVSLKELALLELEFLAKVEWRIVPRAEVLVDYYRSLVEREPLFQMDTEAKVAGVESWS